MYPSKLYNGGASQIPHPARPANTSMLSHHGAAVALDRPVPNGVMSGAAMQLFGAGYLIKSPA